MNLTDVVCKRILKMKKKMVVISNNNSKVNKNISIYLNQLFLHNNHNNNHKLYLNLYFSRNFNQN